MSSRLLWSLHVWAGLGHYCQRNFCKKLMHQPLKLHSMKVFHDFGLYFCCWINGISTVSACLANISLWLDKSFPALFGKEIELPFPLYVSYESLRVLGVILPRYHTWRTTIQTQKGRYRLYSEFLDHPGPRLGVCGDEWRPGVEKALTVFRAATRSPGCILAPLEGKHQQVTALLELVPSVRDALFWPQALGGNE